MSYAEFSYSFKPRKPSKQMPLESIREANHREIDRLKGQFDLKEASTISDLRVAIAGDRK